MFRGFAAAAALTLAACTGAEVSTLNGSEAPERFADAAVITPDVQAILDASAATNIGYEIVEGLTTE
ncbi:MAG: hypothetical protein AAGJ85_06140, partial [Pseudomonadota bacterium]